MIFQSFVAIKLAIGIASQLPIVYSAVITKISAPKKCPGHFGAPDGSLQRIPPLKTTKPRKTRRKHG